MQIKKYAFTATIGRNDTIIGMFMVSRDIIVEAVDAQQAHKLALFKCAEDELVMKIIDFKGRQRFDYRTGFMD